jgi:hypothetical protein
VVRANVQPLPSFRKEAMPAEKLKKTKGMRMNPPSWTSTAVTVYVACWKKEDSPKTKVAASPNAVAAK